MMPGAVDGPSQDSTQHIHPPADPVYRAVLAACEPGAIAAELARAWKSWNGEPPPLSLDVEVLQTHYKPFARARIVADARIGLAGKEGKLVHQYLYLQIYPSDELARSRAAAAGKKRSLKCYGPPVFVARPWHALVWALPNGPKLRPTSVFLQREKYQCFLSTHNLVSPSMAAKARLPALIRYVPRRRAVFRHEQTESGKRQCFYVKVYHPEGDESAARHLHLMETATAGGELGFASPRVLLHDQRRRAIVTEEIRGVSFTSLIANVDPVDFAQVGRALAGLHRARIAAEKRWRPADELAALRAAMCEIQAALPALAQRVEGVFNSLEQRTDDLAFEHTAPIHGNLFGDQILLSRGRVGIVDWDDLCKGDPIFDVGRLLAHVFFVAKRQKSEAFAIARCIDALLQAYESGSSRPIPHGRLAWHVATALLLRAKISGLRTLPSRWIDSIASSVDEARLVLDGQSEYSPRRWDTET